MRAGVINKSPQDWLKDLGELPQKVTEVLNSFQKGAHLQVCVYRAEHVFLRFHAAKAKHAIYCPNYWVDGSALGAAFGRAPVRRHADRGGDLSYRQELLS